MTTLVDSATNTTLADPSGPHPPWSDWAWRVDPEPLTERGDDANVFIGWDESADQFIVATTTDDGTAGNIRISLTRALQVGSLIADDTTDN